MAFSIENESAKTASCVSNLIQSFTNGLNIFKRLHARRRKRKDAKLKDKPDTLSGAELQLSNSLKRGTTEIQERYDIHYCRAGDRYAKGDAIAHASLAETLIKLNTGLVGIIAAFLNHNTKTHLNLDYKSLTSLSNASRSEAIESLNKLYDRLSQSQLHMYQIDTCAQCGSAKHQICPGVISPYSPSSKGKASPEKTRQAGVKSRSTTPTITRVSSKRSRQTQLVMVRPRASRKGSSSSSCASSTRSQSTVLSSPFSSPNASPLPQYAQLDPFPAPSPPAKATSSATRRRAESFDGPRLPTWPHIRPENVIPLPSLYPPPPPPPPPKEPSPRRTSSNTKEKQPATPSKGPVSRRLDKPTPSTYTFLSDSTKLGEIPERNWTIPWNYEQAERLNAEAMARPSTATTNTDSKHKPKKGLFKFMRRSTGESP